LNSSSHSSWTYANLRRGFCSRRFEVASGCNSGACIRRPVRALKGGETPIVRRDTVRTVLPGVLIDESHIFRNADGERKSRKCATGQSIDPACHLQKLKVQ
jgi:hypothetical protein